MATSTDRNESDTRALAHGDEHGLTEARRRIASLLATAYRRFVAMQRTQDDQAAAANQGLANSQLSSVHEVVL
jgi:hypothetical protein